MEPNDALRVFGTENFASFVQKGTSTVLFTVSLYVYKKSILIKKLFFKRFPFPFSINQYKYKFGFYSSLKINLKFTKWIKYSYLNCVGFYFVGAVIGLEFNGDGCIETVQSALRAFQQEQICDYFCSESRSEAEKQIEDFYNYADMQMAV